MSTRRPGWRRLDDERSGLIGKRRPNQSTASVLMTIGAVVLAAILITTFVLSIVGLVRSEEAHSKINDRQKTTEYNISEVNRILFPYSSGWATDYYQSLFPNGVNNSINGNIPPLNNYYQTIYSLPLGDMNALYRRIDRTTWDAASDDDVLSGSRDYCTKGQYKTFLASELQLYLDGIPPPGQLTGSLYPPFGHVSGTVGWTHKSGRHIIAVGLNNALLVIDADQLAKYKGHMNYEQAVSRNIVLARFGLPHSLWHEVEHFGKDGEAQDWIMVTQETAVVSAGILIVDATDLNNIHITNLNQQAPNGGLTDVSTIYNSIPMWLNPGTPVPGFDPSCPEFKDDGGITMACHYLRKEHGYINATGRSIMWVTGCQHFTLFAGSSCPSPPYQGAYELDLNPIVPLGEVPIGHSRRRMVRNTRSKPKRRKIDGKSLLRKLTSTRHQNLFPQGGIVTEADALSHGPGRTFAIDVSNPAQVFRVPGASIEDGTYCHDFTTVRQNGRIYGFCSEIYSEYWPIWDITDLSTISSSHEVSRYIPPPLYTNDARVEGVYESSACWAHSITFDISGTVAYAACENPGLPLHVVDVSNVFDPKLLRYITLDYARGALWHEGQAYRPNQGLDGIDVLYMALYDQGLAAIDTYGENARNPKIVGQLSNAGRTLGDGTMIHKTATDYYGGYWGVHPIHGWKGYVTGSSWGELYHPDDQQTDLGFGGNWWDVRVAKEYEVKINPDNALILMTSFPISSNTKDGFKK